MPNGEQAEAKPTPEELRLMSRYGNVDPQFGGVAIVSTNHRLLRVAISYGPHRVWLQERAGGAAIQIEVGGMARGRRSTRTRTWREAVALADAEVRALVLNDHTNEVISGAADRAREVGLYATLEELEENYRLDRFSKGARNPITDSHMNSVARAVATLKILKGPHWRPYEEIVANPYRFVEWFVTIRTTSVVRFPRSWERASLLPLRPKSAVSQLKDFSSVLTRGKLKGLIPGNPLGDFVYSDFLGKGDDAAMVHRQESSWEVLGRLLSPPSHPVTGVPLLDAGGEPLPAPVHRCRAQDGGRRLRILLTSVALSGKRPSDFLGTAISGVRVYPFVKDVARTTEEVQRVLEEAKNHRVTWARHWPDGAFVAWRNKAKHHRVTPMGTFWRREMDEWLTHHPDPKPDAPLICSLSDPTKPLDSGKYVTWFGNAIAAAREDAIAMGLDPDEYMPIVADSKLGGFRPLWRTTMMELGWDDPQDPAERRPGEPALNKHALFMGGWAVGVGQVQQRVYLRLRPEYLYAVANFEHAKDVKLKVAESVRGKITAALHASNSSGAPTSAQSVGRGRKSPGPAKRSVGNGKRL
jgi:hypothetical protein